MNFTEYGQLAINRRLLRRRQRTVLYFRVIVFVIAFGTSLFQKLNVAFKLRFFEKIYHVKVYGSSLCPTKFQLNRSVNTALVDS